jgi:hypothetical protein
MPVRILISAARRAQVGRHDSVCDCIGARYLNKVIIDRLVRHASPVNTEANGPLVDRAAR